MAEAGYLAEFVREAAPERYLATLYAPADRRDALLTLHAFDTELATLRDKVREPMAGEIRLQWWRDTLAAPAGEHSGHPVADALKAVIARHSLPAGAFEGMLEARVFDLYDDPMPDRATLEGYLGETRAALIQLCAIVLDPEGAPRFASAAGHAGCALGIAELLRALPVHRRRGQCFVPADLLSAAGIDREAFLAGGVGAQPAIAAMVALGRDHYTRFREEARGMPSALVPAFLPLSSVEPLLDATEGAGVRAFEQPAAISTLRRQWRMLRRAGGRW